MDKPIILVARETEEGIVKIINNSKLPAFILRNIVEKVYEQLCKIEVEQYEEAKKTYEDEANQKDNTPATNSSKKEGS